MADLGHAFDPESNAEATECGVPAEIARRGRRGREDSL
jgi:hypothetical protein